MFEILKEAEFTLIEKKSKFICRIFKIENEEEAKKKIKSIVELERGATHNCYAYRIYNKNGVIERKNDDGEPAGTAGNPMLSVLSYENLINLIAITTRYFGGIKLGASGLVNAYKKSVIETVKICGKKEFVIKDIYYLRFYINNVKIIDNLLKINDIEIIERKFSGKEVEYIIKMPEVKIDIFKNNQLFLEFKNIQ
ncbi:MAG TPA: YigZ family protein [Spirochaetota bacterium]|nr:YigZ family protein [Spirochaetota bacterium]HOL56838.1 YigZ family protein [Spirochaetota bacterium]HPP04399.1 YigZ family protein [Spirochaetota bacterium]